MDYRKLTKIVDGEETPIVNTEADGDNLFEVGIWSGYGYALDMFRVYAFSEEDALEKVVAYCEANGHDDLFVDDYEQEFKKELMEEKGYDEYEVEETPEYQETFFYVDATMEGASAPHYLRSENLIVYKVK